MSIDQSNDYINEDKDELIDQGKIKSQKAQIRVKKTSKLINKNQITKIYLENKHIKGKSICIYFIFFYYI